MKNKSLNHEFEMIRYLNNKKYSDFPEKWQKHLLRIFPNIKSDTVVHCSKHENYFAKGDIDVRIKGSKKIISLKNGKNPTMHRERFTWLYHTLKDMGVSADTLNMITMYQFGECYTFGHFKKPLTKEEIVERFGDQILKANKELNDEKFMDMMIDRAILIGRKEYRQKIDYLYYGNLEKGLLISVDQICQSIKSRKKLSSSWIQFGQLVFQPGGRSRDNDDYLETTIHWPVLSKLFYVCQDENDIMAYDIENR